MSSRICLPVNQVRLTNVAVVRMNRHGKRFEIACYRNKVLNYRQGVETDLSEVLQTTRIFINVSKGLFAPSADLLHSFDTSDQEKVCRIILDEGQIQTGDMERSATLENTAREVANMVAVKCVHPVSRRPYTVRQVRDAMKEAGFVVQATGTRSVKQQFLDCVKAVQAKGVLDICRAQMELAIAFGEGGIGKDEITRRLEGEAQASIVGTDGEGKEKDAVGARINRIQFMIDPSYYRAIDAVAKENGGKLEMIRHAVTQEGDADVSSELERNSQRQTEHDAAALKLYNIRSTTSDKGEVSKQSQDSGVDILAGEVGTILSLNKGDGGHRPQHDEDDTGRAVNSRKNNKKAQKKSKKAKRREKEEAALRQERKDAETARREEREFQLSLKSKNDDAVTGTTTNPVVAVGSSVGTTKSCNTCGGEFTPQQYRVHFKSDWHRYNVKLKMSSAVSVSEKEFLTIDSELFFDGGF